MIDEVTGVLKKHSCFGADREHGRQLELYYTYGISEDQCARIEADVAYDLEVSPHRKIVSESENLYRIFKNPCYHQ